MNANRKQNSCVLKRTVFSMVLCALGVLPAKAATITQVQPYGLQQAPFNQLLSFNQFDPLLGTLHSATWTISLTTTGGRLGVDNDDAASAATVSGQIEGRIALAQPPLQTMPRLPGLATSNSTTPAPRILTADNGDGGTFDSSVPDGVLWTNSGTQTGGGTNFAPFPNDYYGTGAFNVVARATDATQVTAVTGVPASSIQTNVTPVNAQGTLQLVYNYTPVPEPTSGVLIAVGSAIFLSVRRSRRVRFARMNLTIVPEPTSIGLVCVGAATFITCARRRRR